MAGTVEFDPGYAKHITSFINNIEYIYGEINKFKNLGQKKFKFKSFYPQILILIEQNIAFYLGCLLWAVYVSSNKGFEIVNNPCLNLEYDEDIELEEIKYILKFIENFNRDTKYYMNSSYNLPDNQKYILNTYIEFAKINKGFVNAKMTDDIILPKQIKIPTKENILKIYNIITKDIVINGNFKKLFDLENFIL